MVHLTLDTYSNSERAMQENHFFVLKIHPQSVHAVGIPQFGFNIQKYYKNRMRYSTNPCCKCRTAVEEITGNGCLLQTEHRHISCQGTKNNLGFKSVVTVLLLNVGKI